MRRMTAALVLIVLAQPAWADSIDGEWCSPEGGKRLTIDGPTLRTPGGKTIQADYRKYSVTYTAPAGDWEAGQTIDLQFVRRVGVRVTVRGGAESIWKTCPPGVS